MALLKFLIVLSLIIINKITSQTTTTLTNSCSTLGLSQPVQAVDCLLSKVDSASDVCCFVSVTLDGARKSACKVMTKNDKDATVRMKGYLANLGPDATVNCNSEMLKIGTILFGIFALFFL
jgi:hypothetical protein